MRKRKITKMIGTTEEVHDKIVKDKKHFQKTIGGGKWSNGDVIQEYQKIIDTGDNNNKNKNKPHTRKLENSN